eukprot:3885440-Ditylum_brightwellii.AAC.1
MDKEAQLTFKNNAKILEDPNVFIGDTGATTDTTSSQFGFKNIRKQIQGMTQWMPLEMGLQEIHEATTKEVVHMPKAGYNLFSLTKRLGQGWTLGGDSNAIWITKGSVKIIFDIKIKTPK